MDSIVYQTANGIGIGDTPNAMLDVHGKSIFRGVEALSRSGDATASAGAPSSGLLFQSSVYNSSRAQNLLPYFQLQTEPNGNNTATTNATFNFLYYNGVGTAPIETGLYFNPDGTIHFVPSQTFPITQGPAGPAGPQGAPGTVTLPYYGTAATNGYVLEVGNIGNGSGLAAYGGKAFDGNSTLGGYGAVFQGGDSAGDTSTTGSSGGLGIEVIGGNGYVSGTHNEPGGAGAYLIGGYNGGYGAVAYGASGPGGVGLEVYPGNSGGQAADFFGDVYVGGTLSKAGGSFKIDDPIDPANKYLSHSFVESPDMMNIYNGNVVTDGTGEAVVILPEYFEALNRDFRYQLTSIGQLSQAYVASEISNGKFVIKTDRPGVKVSWQVTGVRQDAWANAHRIPNEEEKPDVEKGHYLSPELFGHAGEKDVFAVNRQRIKPTPIPSSQTALIH